MPEIVTFSFLNLSRRLFNVVDRGRSFFLSPSLSYASLSPFTYPGALPVISSSLPLLFPSSTLTAQPYRTAEVYGWVPGPYEEEDNRQQTKNEPGEKYKKSQQEALD
jgi:hypothetical protein